MKTFKKRICNICGEDGIIWYEKKWWCSYCTAMGSFNMKGYCKNEKINDSDAK